MTLRHLLEERQLGDADERALDQRRIGKGTEHVEDGPKAEGTTDRRRGSQVRGGSVGANRNPMPASSTQARTTSSAGSSRTPSASSRSAEPTDDEAERLPCLATGTPHPATAKAAMVETFTLCSWSPPVPTMSIASGPIENVVAQSIIASTKPIISSAVSPLAVSAVRKLAMSTGSTRPDKDLRQGGASLDVVRGRCHERAGSECRARMSSCVQLRGKPRRRHSDTIAVASCGARHNYDF